MRFSPATYTLLGVVGSKETKATAGAAAFGINCHDAPASAERASEYAVDVPTTAKSTLAWLGSTQMRQTYGCEKAAMGSPPLVAAKVAPPSVLLRTPARNAAA